MTSWIIRLILAILALERVHLSATKGDMRLISVVMGTASQRARKTENKKLLTKETKQTTHYTCDIQVIAVLSLSELERFLKSM